MLVLTVYIDEYEAHIATNAELTGNFHDQSVSDTAPVSLVPRN